MSLIIGLGSESALKVRATHRALTAILERGVMQLENVSLKRYDLRTGKTESGVPDQPFGPDQMFLGATNRARAALKAHNADIGIGIENGLLNVGTYWFDPPAVVVLYPRTQIVGRALGAALPIPTDMVRAVKERDTELGVIVQERAGGGEKDPHKFLSKGVVDREEIIAQAILSAFAPLISADEYRVFNPNR